MTPPPVLYRHRNGRLDTKVTAWSPADTRPLVPEVEPRPLHPRGGCWCQSAPELAELAEVCRCTRQQRDYRAKHPGGGV